MSLKKVSLIALNSTSGEPILGARFFVNGSDLGPQPEVPIGVTSVFEAKQAGFFGQAKSVVVSGGDAPVSISVLLTPVSSDVTIRLQFYPSIAGISWTITGGSGPVKAANSYTDGVSVVTGVAPGSYTLVATFTGYEQKTQVIEVSADRRSFVVSMVKTASGGGAPVGEPVNDLNGGVNSEDLLIGDDVSEEIANNASYLQYFTSAQARLYIGNLFIDQMNTLQWALQQNNVPVFGYCSEFMDAIGRGRSIIQGQLVINYVHQGYLFAALRNYDKFVNSTPSPSATAATLSKLLRATAVPSATSPVGVSQDQLQAGVSAKLDDTLKNATPEDVRQAKKHLQPAAARNSYADNPVYRHSLFDMRLEIGEGSNRSVRLLERCKLGVNEVLVHAQSGEPILESYTFTARRAR